MGDTNAKVRKGHFEKIQEKKEVTDLSNSSWRNISPNTFFKHPKRELYTGPGDSRRNQIDYNYHDLTQISILSLIITQSLQK